MERYDPEVAPIAEEWLELDEGERISLVEDYHRRKRIRLPQARLHATIHVVVENQLALGEQVVIQTLDRLQAEGLTRHDALHAIGLVVAEHLVDLMRSDPKDVSDPNAPYFERLRRLSASSPDET